jgi:hypothetical protein
VVLVAVVFEGVVHLVLEVTIGFVIFAMFVFLLVAVLALVVFAVFAVTAGGVDGCDSLGGDSCGDRSELMSIVTGSAFAFETKERRKCKERKREREKFYSLLRKLDVYV